MILEPTFTTALTQFLSFRQPIIRDTVHRHTHTHTKTQHTHAVHTHTHKLTLTFLCLLPTAEGRLVEEPLHGGDVQWDLHRAPLLAFYRHDLRPSQQVSHCSPASAWGERHHGNCSPVPTETCLLCVCILNVCVVCVYRVLQALLPEAGPAAHRYSNLQRRQRDEVCDFLFTPRSFPVRKTRHVIIHISIF